MDTLLQYWMTILRDEKTERAVFRTASYQVARIMAYKIAQKISVQKLTVETPISSASGLTFTHSPLLVPILRSGMAMLPAFLDIFPDAPVGVVGLKRDEKTAIAHWYYENVPPFDPSSQIVILDPMIATGGTGIETLTFLAKKGALQKNIMYASIVSAPEGIELIKREFPEIDIMCAAQDKGLTKDKFIIPGLGDFGDRFFGTEL
jgi:uracil phosphoribosyltransferase